MYNSDLEELDNKKGRLETVFYVYHRDIAELDNKKVR